MTVSISSDL